MADEQPQNTPSAEPSPSTDVEASAPASEQTDEPPSSPSWWQRLFNRRPVGQEDAPSSQEQAASADPVKVVLTQDELERKIQSEADRREAKRANEARAREMRELRDKDPWEHSKRLREAEELQSAEANQMQFFAAIGSEFDKVSIDPIFERLPDEERQRILKLEGAQNRGLDGRRLIVSESMKALEKHWKAEGAREAETRLRKNTAFRKQVLSEARGQTPEPEVISGVGRSNGADQTVSALLRGFYNLGEHNEMG